MSSASVTSSKRLKSTAAELSQEVESVRALNATLRTYLEHIRGFKKNLIAMNDNYKQLSKVNKQWVDTLKHV